MIPHQMQSGAVIDLLDPDFAALDIVEDFARPLAGLRRFGGGGWSVAQHSVIGADAALDETGDIRVALAFLVHDAHEVVLGDWPRPARTALSAHVDRALAHVFGRSATAEVDRALGGDLLTIALDGLAARLDAAIRRRAGLPEVLPLKIAREVAEMDVRVLDLERRLRRPTTGRGTRETWGAVVDSRPIRIKGGEPKQWSPDKAAAEWTSRWDRWTRALAPAPITPKPAPRTDRARAIAHIVTIA